MSSNVNLDDLRTNAGGRFNAVILSARRARQINGYFNQLGEGIGSFVPPQVHSLSRQPLSIAFEEVLEEKIVPGSDSED